MSIDQKLDEILTRLMRLESEREKSSPKILTLVEAMDHVKIVGQGVTPARLKAFYRWRKRNRVPSKRRYSTDVLDLALARETGVVRLPKSFGRAA